jgi:hypothetical protein
MATMAFDRDFKWFTGGHLKCFHYFTHARAAGWDARVTFTPGSALDDTNPWIAAGIAPSSSTHPDVWFLAGHDWDRVHPAPNEPVINLIQHLRHADPTDPRYAHLRRPAVRITVSQEVQDAIEATGIVAGPVITIPNGLDLALAPPRRAMAERPVDVLVVANKAPQRAAGTEVGRRLRRRGRTVRVIDQRVPRAAFLAALADARVAAFVPNPQEGFYLPALEAMAAGTLAVCPDVVGNRSFCRHLDTAIVPDHGAAPIAAAAEAGLALLDGRPAEAAALRDRAIAQAQQHTLGNERRQFHAVLATLPSLWQTALGAAA